MRRTFLALLLLSTATPVLAQTSPARPPEDAAGHAEGEMRGGMFGRADANGDGAITRAEAIAAADARFDRMDGNHDGTVTPEEMKAARDAMRRRGGPDGPPPPPPPADGARPDRPRPAPRAMTREESRTRALAMFARADTNGDGTLDKAELADLRPMRGHGPRGEGPGGDMPPPPPQD